MSVKNYRFVSPGVFVNEIDNSQIPASPAGQGPVVFGRAAKGPALRPVTVNSFEEYVNIFGTPSPGFIGDDVWRLGDNRSATTYGMYGAQAYLRNSSPLTYVRLLGAQDDDATTTGKAGWESDTAWGLVVFESGSGTIASLTGALSAVWYADSGINFRIRGNIMSSSGVADEFTGNPVVAASPSLEVSGSGFIVQENNSTRYQFKMDIVDGSDVTTTTFNFNENDSRYIRKVFNTNPQKTNSGITTNTVSYFLGETFDRHLKANIDGTVTMATVVKLYNDGIRNVS